MLAVEETSQPFQASITGGNQSGLPKTARHDRKPATPAIKSHCFATMRSIADAGERRRFVSSFEDFDVCGTAVDKSDFASLLRQLLQGRFARFAKVHGPVVHVQFDVLH